MVLMKRAVPMIVITGSLVGAGYVLYRYMLSDEAKSAVKTAAQSMKQAYESISDLMAQAYGHVVEEEVTDHQREIRSKWDALGI